MKPMFVATEEQLRAMVTRLRGTWTYAELSRSVIYWRDRDDVTMREFGWIRATQSEQCIAMLKAATTAYDPEMRCVNAIKTELLAASTTREEPDFYRAVLEEFIKLPLKEPA